jgi:apoptosis-stimulating of p53 protein 1
LLIEHGACVFATSVSDSETPAQKCEEAIKATQDVQQQDYYDGCYAYLETADKCMGIVNDGKVS